jgi:steroid 5-alpha reductase family enzyme
MKTYSYLGMMLAPLLLIHLFYVLAVVKKNLSVIDTAWGLGFITISLAGLGLAEESSTLEKFLATLVLVWGLRLAVFLHLRNSGKPEDYRYAQWRKDWGEKTNRIAYVKVYILQWGLMLVVGLPIFGVHNSHAQVGFWQILGASLWLVGLLWESVADAQKSRFKAIPGNEHRLCQVGLWRLSRHPNYFGEALLWWGIGFAAIHDHNYWVLLGPAFINFLLLKVSGVPLIEARHQKNPEYEAYKKVTPTMIPSVTKLWK